MQQINDLVFTNRTCTGGRERGGISGVWLGVDSQEDEPVALITVHSYPYRGDLALGPNDGRMAGFDQDGSTGFHVVASMI